MLACKPSNVSMEQSVKLCGANGDDISYVGTLTRPDISYVIHKLSQFMKAHKMPHLQPVYKVLKYLKKTPGQVLFLFAHSELPLKSYCDANWVTCVDTRRSISGFYVFLGESLLSWK
ncbi:hypothetical protein RGQ29_012990 [Quercus rubra]|uniref:Uncharacterized protein n=1 Tax=Quercus rubra TaxID=3512 RepID=A0AAN7GBS0_QUERU|nr:hypothetical protein RGQ29_012990 [Quercus rubra]